MPRIRDSSNSPLDFCLKCFPSEKVALKRYNNAGDGPDGRGNCFCYDDEHPDYENEGYTCWDCNKRLTNKDNYSS